MSPEPQPHDLVLVEIDELTAPDGRPLSAEAVAATRLGSPAGDCAWVVVRRAPSDHGYLPAGIRGTGRSDRFAARVPTDGVVRVVPPSSVPFEPAPDRSDLPAFTALRRLRMSLADDPGATRWGPGGSVGFELVSGYPSVTPESDLDLVVDAPLPLSHTTASALLDRLRSDLCRVDAQLISPLGGVALAEWARDDGRPVALRTADGPRLVRDPWSGS